MPCKNGEGVSVRIIGNTSNSSGKPEVHYVLAEILAIDTHLYDCTLRGGREVDYLKAICELVAELVHYARKAVDACQLLGLMQKTS
jgi:hypothetical protein